jgi:hypothetical protein
MYFFHKGRYGERPYRTGGVIVQAVAEPPMYFFHKGRYGERPYRLFSRQIIKGKSRFLSCSRRGTKRSDKLGLVGILLEEQGFKFLSTHDALRIVLCRSQIVENSFSDRRA